MYDFLFVGAVGLTVARFAVLASDCAEGTLFVVFRLVRVVTGLRLELESLFELDRDTLHTRLGSSHECHSGGGRGAFALVSLRLVGLAIHGLVSVEVAIQSQLSRTGVFTVPGTGFGYCAFRGSGSRQGRREVEPYPTDRARGTPLLQTAIPAEFQQRLSAFWLVCDVGSSVCHETWFGGFCTSRGIRGAHFDRISLSLWAVDTQNSIECIYARAGMPNLFLQQSLDCFGLLGTVGVDGGPGLLFLHQIVSRARVFELLDLLDPIYLTIACESLIELDRDTLAYSVW
uniref:Secreted protein n=1 Tax=Ananas comosus var. bracteatus TaxID=296719 RepID=A0A6V7NPF8_ANACO|nr:unnamed protein product [Ananas comosus var. bracteatus]